MDVSILIPCFDEVENVPRLLEALDEVVTELRAAGRCVEVIAVDDGSRDGTYEELRQAAAAPGRDYLRLLRFRRNFGQTAAIAAAIDHAQGNVLVPMDADLQNDPRDIPLLLAKLEEGYDVVSGWRRQRKDALLRRVLPSRLANGVISWVSGVHLHDYGCTLKAYRREVLAPVHLYGEMHRFIPIYAHSAGARIAELPVRHHPRTAGRSKVGIGRTIKVLLDLLTVKFLGGYSTKPLYLFGGMGLLFCVLGALAAGYTVWERLYTTYHAVRALAGRVPALPAELGLPGVIYVHRNPLFIVAVFLVLLGVQFLFMGLLAEVFLVRTYHESQRKPTYLVRESYRLGEAPGAAAAAAAAPGSRAVAEAADRPPPSADG